MGIHKLARFQESCPLYDSVSDHIGHDELGYTVVTKKP